jgi:flagellar P-ring protein precursor FlgI
MKHILITLTFLLLIKVAPAAHAARLKDIADIEGVRGNQLFGYGIVIGLNGTGDGKIDFTNKSISNMLERLGVRVDPKDVKVKNIASVLLTATLPAFVRPGSKIDVTLSSLGDAKSIQGGTLLMAPLKAADGATYAVAQGPVSVGGFAVESGGDSAQKNHPTVGVISGGANVEKAISFDLFQAKRIRVVLREPDFTTVHNMVGRINTHMGRPLAVAVDGAAVEVPLSSDLMRDPIALVSELENIEVPIDVGAKIIVNERTGTIIMGEAVRVSRVALAHGNLSIAIRTENQVSQPGALSQGQTATVQNTDVNVGEEVKSLQLVGGQVTLGDLVRGLNSLGATPRDLISIFAALKKAGALQADLVIM